MKVQLITPYRVSHLQRYGFTVRGNVASVDPSLSDADLVKKWVRFGYGRLGLIALLRAEVTLHWIS